MEEEGEMDQARASKLRKRLAEMQKMQEAEAQIRAMLRGVLEPEAYERLMNVRISNPELYMQVAQMLITLARNKQLAGKVGEKDLRALLAKLTERHEGGIHIERK